MSQKNDRYYTALDIQLQNLATIDWPAFVALIGEENITRAKVCLLQRKGKSLNQIANTLSITREQVKYQCSKNCGKFSTTID